MDSLELPLDMQWASVASKAEPLSPTALEGFTNDPFAAELWSITKDESLSCKERKFWILFSNDSRASFHFRL